uniref:Uncharacterized protein n=1 Tax=Peronospora matthiolae TaxID=2874970 RepID=A0AAV1ULB4_9STRA
MNKSKPASPVSFDIAKPSDSDLLVMAHLYYDGADCYIILRKPRDLNPGVAEVSPYSVDLGVGALISKVGHSKLIASSSSDHGNAKVEELLGSGQIDVLEPTSNDSISIGAKLLKVKRSLVGEQVTLLNHQIAFKETSVLDTCHDVGVFGVSTSRAPELSLIFSKLGEP